MLQVNAHAPCPITILHYARCMQNYHSISNRKFCCFSYIIAMVHKNSPIVELWNCGIVDCGIPGLIHMLQSKRPSSRLYPHATVRISMLQAQSQCPTMISMLQTESTASESPPEGGCALGDYYGRAWQPGSLAAVAAMAAW